MEQLDNLSEEILQSYLANNNSRELLKELLVYYVTLTNYAGDSDSDVKEFSLNLLSEAENLIL